jgi:dipeptidyl aminopeptidase/acylaminoacyl peptidase
MRIRKVKFFGLTWSLLLTVICCGQKPALSLIDMKNLPGVFREKISNNGWYVAYSISNSPVGRNRLVLQATDNSWKQEIEGASTSFFVNNDKQIVYKKKDSLIFQTLGSDQKIIFDSIASFWVPTLGNIDKLFFKKKKGSELNLFNFKTYGYISFANVKWYKVDDHGRKLILVEEIKSGGIKHQIKVVDLTSLKTSIIWTSSDSVTLHNFVFDDQGSQVAFIEKAAEGLKEVKSIWLFQDGDIKAKRVAWNNSLGIDSGLVVSIKPMLFSHDGKNIYFFLSESHAKNQVAGIDIWSYADAELQSKQLTDVKLMPARLYKAVVDLSKNRIIQLEHGDVKVLTNYTSFLITSDQSATLEYDVRNDEIVILQESTGTNEWYWNRYNVSSLFIMDLKTGNRKRLPEKFAQRYVDNCVFLSPGGKFILYYDFKKRNWFSYEISTAVVSQPSGNVAIDWTDNLHEVPQERLFTPAGSTGPNSFVTAWIAGDSAFLVRDAFGDFWQLDPKGIAKPINMTNGFAKKYSVSFSLNDAYADAAFDDNRVPNSHRTLLISQNDHIFLTGLNKKQKINSIYRTSFDVPKDPELLTSEFGPAFTKAKDKNAFVLKKATSTELPNYYYTSDFKKFTALSDVHPERKYNWVKGEVLNWKTLNGSMTSGILFKPENFERGKKYPVIFSYYDQRGEGNYLNSPATGTLDVLYYVSNGYCVFSPEIHYPPYLPAAQCAYDAIVSGAKFISKLPYIDASRLGLRGHSFGAYQTDYIVTHSRLFAAAVSTAGMTNAITGSLSTWDKNGDEDLEGTGQTYYKMGQPRFWFDIYERPDLYVKYSPVFDAHKVTTPLLLVNNRLDFRVPYDHGLGLFLGLRRLGKRAWMIQYDGGGHGPPEEFKVREKQFYDHYLKDSAAPEWMLYGIPARKKGEDDGLELVREKDPKTGKWVTPQVGGVLTDEEKKKAKALEHRKPIKLIL